jgi:multicomponent Na+:H+ antiporter subunit A
VIEVLVGLHVVAALACLVLGARLRRWIFAVALAPIVVSLVTVSLRLASILDGNEPTSSRTWVAGLSLTFSFRLDGFAALMALVVTGIGAVVIV